MKERNLDKEAHEENSSSQNVKLSILRIIRRGAQSSKTEVLLSNGSSFFIPPKIVLQNNLESGGELSELQVEELKLRSEYIFAKKKALDLLASREHSVYQLKQKLLKREFVLEIVNKVLEELQNEGALSNTRYIENWVYSRLRKHPEGYRSLFANLLRAGISSEEANNYLIPYFEELDVYEILDRAAEKMMKKNTMTKEKIIRGLKSRGFEYSDIIKFIDRYFSEYSQM